MGKMREKNVKKKKDPRPRSSSLVRPAVTPYVIRFGGRREFRKLSISYNNIRLTDTQTHNTQQ